MASGSSDDEVINRVIQRVIARVDQRRRESNQEVVPRPIRQHHRSPVTTPRLTTGCTRISVCRGATLGANDIPSAFQNAGRAIPARYSEFQQARIVAATEVHDCN